MNAVCTRCGKKVDGEGLAFCPYCGEKLPAAEKEIKPAVRNEEAEKWVQKALGRTSFPERKKKRVKADCRGDLRSPAQNGVEKYPVFGEFAHDSLIP